MSRLVDLSLAVPHGFRGPPSTVNLAELPTRCTFFAPFYKFAGIDAAPARAFAQVSNESP